MTAPEDSTMDPLVRLDGIHVRHRARSGGLLRRDSVHALTDVTPEVGRGEILGLVGESGCGKSTLARVVPGPQRPTEGTVSFRGRDLWAMSAAERRTGFGAAVGVVVQDAASTALNPRLPVRRILRDPLDVHDRGTRRSARTGWRSCSIWPGCPVTPFRRCRGSCPAVSSSAWPSPVPSRWNRS